MAHRMDVACCVWPALLIFVVDFQVVLCRYGWVRSGQGKVIARAVSFQVCATNFNFVQ
eukprot:SAG31_NODE_642_length_13301_cov_14.143084_12_plen_58_part_00